ncbi:MAG: bacterial transcriptional activator domain-containing protein [Methylomicrobium sp.]|nr:bacterial transcriptional activator domain-containing protein [Methylomicrobium sp.]
MKIFNLRNILLVSVAIFSNSSVAQNAQDGSLERITAKDLALMPPFCKGLSPGNYSEDAIHLRRTDIKQPKGNHNHHFCHAMKDMGRRKYSEAIKNFDYVITNSGDPNKLTPDFYPLLAANRLYRAEALVKLGKPGALEDYKEAIRLRPKYIQAYAKLADYYINNGMKDEAIKTIESGLKQDPKSKGLHRRLKKYKIK